MSMLERSSDGFDWFVTAEFWDGATGRAIAAGLRNVHAPVIEIDNGRFFPSRSSISLRMALRLMRPMASRAYNQAILDALRDGAPSYLLLIKGQHMTPETLVAAAGRGAMSIIYYPDYHFNYPDFDASILQAVDIVCTTKRFHLPYLRDLRGSRPSVLVQHGYSSASHVPLFGDMTEDDFQYDICYAGNADAYKLQWLVALARHFPDKRIAVAGHHWKAFTEGTPLARHILGRVVVGRRLARLHQLSRVNIAIHGGRDPVHGWQDDVSTRTFEIPACRGFMLHIDNEEVRGLYDVPTEIDTFATPNDMCAKVAHYLAHPELRAGMVERAYRRAVPAYSYDSRAEEIHSIAQEWRATGLKSRRSS